MLRYCDHHLLPLPNGHKFPLAKYRLLRERLQGDPRFLVEPSELASRSAVLRVHDPGYANGFLTGTLEPHVMRRIGFPWSPELVTRTLASAGGTLLATQTALETGFGGTLAAGTHHAFRDAGSGFCVFNDVVVAIRTLLAAGARKVAYVDIDVHHGDGVQAAFYDDPRVLTISLHQDPRTLFPGTGLPVELGVGEAEGTSVNVALPPGTDDAGWLRAFNAVVPGAVRAFGPDVLVTQDGCDTHHEDPLANLELSVDGQRTAIAALHKLAHDAANGRWVALGGGGYGVIRCVPRTWTHLLAEASGAPVPPETEIPTAWTEHLRRRGVRAESPRTMGEGKNPQARPWVPGGDSWLDRSIGATRRAAFPLLGLDPDDPRD